MAALLSICSDDQLGKGESGVCQLSILRIFLRDIIIVKMKLKQH